MRLRAVGASIACASASLAVSGCELQDVQVTSVEAVVVAEAFVDVAADPAENVARAFLHWTVGLEDPDVDALFGAAVTFTRDDGYSFTLNGANVDDCLESTPEVQPGACYLDDGQAALLHPGDLLQVDIRLAGGAQLNGASRIPGGFELADLPEECVLPSNTLLPVAWSRSEMAWAYVNETSIRGLKTALESEGIEVEDDPLYLLGLSVSDADTTIVFPSEFGIFNRFDLSPDLSVRLQRGLPGGSRAEVTITATDRNYVNWARGGNFNPSGQVRVPSLIGDGTGVFGTTVGRRFTVLASDDPNHPFPACPTG